MLRNMRKKMRYKRRLYRLSIYKLIKFYKTHVVALCNFKKNKLKLFNSNVYLTLPKRQQHFCFFNLHSRCSITVSTGVLLKDLAARKNLKRSSDNMLSLLLYLRSKYSYYIKKIFLFYIKNFNYRQYVFFHKFLKFIEPQISFFLHRQSYIPRPTRARRIKKRIVKMLKSKSL